MSFCDKDMRCTYNEYNVNIVSFAYDDLAPIFRMSRLSSCFIYRWSVGILN